MKDGLSLLNFKIYIPFDPVIPLSGIDATDIYAYECGLTFKFYEIEIIQCRIFKYVNTRVKKETCIHIYL